MFRLVALFALLGMCCATPILPVPDSRPITQLRSNPNGACSSLYSCMDCNTAQVCRPLVDGTWSPVKTIPCPSTTPYCDSASGTCSANPDPTCGATDDFICPRDGRFPDATNCTRYHVCTDLLSTMFECAHGLNYNPIDQKCETSEVCDDFDCTKLTGLKVNMNTYRHFFAYCYGAVTIVDRCIGDYELNTTSQVCEPICHDEGILTDNDNCQMYYKCSYNYINETLVIPVRDHLKCPQGQGYDPKNFMCVDLTTIPDCKAAVKTYIM